ncbi:hypothetical protein CORT_0C05280 [Candida orthopsilosis Co 90-125]|uniref:Uncharacterized protein n=1 Tax=Candida orthopsilosis (strain 90-125) TaxID=1136231 RepID=H8X342_CANO9|nr:hypothetical protein CORT_0C05280 [Candida orthopsilosis Co 90-125]CCG25902.1 hypothetical protein CORT_0C05280 [Candida orthopsilosis Co 90-125]
MLKQFVQAEFLLDGSNGSTPSTNSTLTNPVTKKSAGSLRVPSFTFARAVSQERRYPTVQGGANGEDTNVNTLSSRRSNFLKVCSWPFSKIDGSNGVKSEDVSVKEPDSRHFHETYDKVRTIAAFDKHLTPNQNTHNSFSNIQGQQRPLTGNPSLENMGQQRLGERTDKLGKVFNRRKHQHRNMEDGTKRCVVLSNLDSTMGMNSVIQQVCGGPLEKVVRISNHRVKLYFIFPQQAKQFYQYGNATGLLKVNGTRLEVSWGDDEYHEESEKKAEDIENYGFALGNFKCKPSSKGSVLDPHLTLPRALYNDILTNGCRRCLIVSKMIVGKKIRPGDKTFYPEPEIHYSQDLQIQNIREDFEPFGEVMDIGSVISRKLSFSVFYYDIRSAIKAKSEFETIGTDLHHKYKDWAIWYGKDITDRACFVL